MAQQTVLEVTPRTVMGKATKLLRQKGLIPANVYGHKEESFPLQIDALAFERLQRGHGARNVLVLHLPDAPTQTALIRHVQRHPVTGKILHVDFSRVSLTESIESKISLNFIGVAPGVKIVGGVLLHLVETLAVECKAGDMVENVDVDISTLTDIDSTLYARDIKLPERYTLLADPDEPIVKIVAPRVEEAKAEETASPAAAAPVATPESSTKAGS